jgi:hypothetical protein
VPRRECRIDRRADNFRGLAGGGIALAEQVVLERQNAVVVGSTAPEHRAGCHHAANIRVDDRLVTRAASRARNAVIRRIDEANVLGALAIEQGVGSFRIGAVRVVPAFWQARLHVRGVLRADVRCIVWRAARRKYRGRTAVAVDAAKHDRIAHVHGLGVAVAMATNAASALCVGVGLRLHCWSGRIVGVVDGSCTLIVVAERDIAAGEPEDDAEFGRDAIHQ